MESAQARAVAEEPVRTVTLNLSGGTTVALTCNAQDIQSAAVRWSQSLRNRRRWLSTAALDERRTRATHEARSLFLELRDEDKYNGLVKRLAQSQFIELVLPVYSVEADDWALRIFPWEFFISAWTHENRAAAGKNQTHLITRVLPRSEPGDVTESGNQSTRTLMVVSKPAALAKHYSFRSEEELLAINLELQGRDFVLTNPSLAEIRRRIVKDNPEVIHLAGYDRHQAARLIPDIATTGSSNGDGFILLENGRVYPETPENLALALAAAPASSLRLVCFNVYNSASRLAAMAVAEGADAAIGFQDEIDDRLAEVFFASFYNEWHRNSESNVHAAFSYAFDSLGSLPREYSLRGSGIVLWSHKSLLVDAAELEEILRERQDDKRSKRRTLESEGISSAEAAAGDFIHSDAALSTPTPLAGDGAGSLFLIDVKPCRRLNYSILHNRNQIFDSFNLTRKNGHSPERVHVDVVVQIGEQEISCRNVFEMQEEGRPCEFADQISVALSWDYLRGLVEAVRTTIYVSIRADDNTHIYSKTHEVILAPLEEWSDSDEDRVWLPSFVLPRDPCVAKIVRKARGYLMALSDDMHAGFDGYQNYGLYPEDPGKAVDFQVRALWYALVNEYKLQYINPPPSYFERSQRLRSPSEVIEYGHATCIDLTLLFAACLEYVDIHPVLFLIYGHAFPGYWRSEAAAMDFVDGVFPVSDSIYVGESATRLGGSNTKPWIYDWTELSRIYAYYAGDHLQAMETTLLAAGGNYFQACDAGTQNFVESMGKDTSVWLNAVDVSVKSPDASMTFEYLFDVRKAHGDENGARPLPMGYKTP